MISIKWIVVIELALFKISFEKTDLEPPTL